MAVTDRDVTALRNQQNQLLAELSRTQAELMQTRQRLADENRLALERLRSETEQRIEMRERTLHSRYSDMLRETSTALESALEAEYRRYQQEYENVTADLNAALVQEHQKTEAVLLRQREFEQAYYARQRFAKERAEASRHAAEAAVQQAAADYPVEWFLPGHISLYNARLRELGQWMENGFYESVIGIAENLILTARLDILECEKQFRRWQQYFVVLCSALDAQRALLFEDAVRVPEDLTRFSRSRDILDGVMQAEALAYWSDGAYAVLVEQYGRTRQKLEKLEQEGALHTEETALRLFMKTHPETAEQLPTERIYRLAMQVSAGIDRAERIIRQMRRRMRAFEERMELVETLRPALRMEEYTVLGTQMTGKPGDPLLIRFCDNLHTMEFELALIPVLRRADGLWVNQTVCSVPAECSPERQDLLRHVLAEVFAAYGIEVTLRTVHGEQTADERLTLAVSDMQLKINGRLN